jgi:hypothetical protein
MRSVTDGNCVLMVLSRMELSSCVDKLLVKSETLSCGEDDVEDDKSGER